MSDEHRVKIQNSNILNALIEHVEGKREMSATQVTAGVSLLRKVLPDLQTTQHIGDPENPIELNHTVKAREMSDDELARIAKRGSK
jgi:ribosomal protein L29